MLTVLLATAAATASSKSSSLAVAAIVVAAASEIMPFTPIKANGIAQMVIQILRVMFPRDRY